MQMNATVEKNMLDTGVSRRNTMLLMAVVFAVALLSWGFDAIAATGTLEGEFADMWGEMKGIAGGAPGKILMMLMVLGVVFFSTVKPNLLGFGGCVIAILVLANAGKIIDSSLTSSIYDVQSLVMPLIGG